MLCLCGWDLRFKFRSPTDSSLDAACPWKLISWARGALRASALEELRTARCAARAPGALRAAGGASGYANVAGYLQLARKCHSQTETMKKSKVKQCNGKLQKSKRQQVQGQTQPVKQSNSYKTNDGKLKNSKSQKFKHRMGKFKQSIIQKVKNARANSNNQTSNK